MPIIRTSASIRVRERARPALRHYLAERGVRTQIHYPTPIHLDVPYRDQLGIRPGALPVSESPRARDHDAAGVSADDGGRRGLRRRAARGIFRATQDGDGVDDRGGRSRGARSARRRPAAAMDGLLPLRMKQGSDLLAAEAGAEERDELHAGLETRGAGEDHAE